MLIYLFISDSEPSVRAFSSDQSGSNLPSEFAPWRRAGSGAIVPIGDDSVTLVVDRDGYLLFGGSASQNSKDGAVSR
jgi:hypothetical protein